MQALNHAVLTPLEQASVRGILDRIAALALFLEHNPVSADPTPLALYEFLAQMKQIQGNTNIGVSLVACLLAKQYLNAHLDMEPFDVARKPQGARGLDIDARTVAGKRVVGEIKSTVPYRARDLGGDQKSTFEKDFKKLNGAHAEYRYFFVTERRTFDLVRQRYARKMPGVQVVLLPDGDTFMSPSHDT
jgi:hypothetical protein